MEVIEKLAKWLSDESNALATEHQGSHDNALRREGMIRAVNTVLKHIEELSDEQDSDAIESKTEDAADKE